MERIIELPKIFADTSKISEIERLVGLGIIHGITTNPIIVAQDAEKESPIYQYEQIAKRFPDIPVSIQLLDEDVPTLIKQARQYVTISPNIVIKVPMFGDGRGLAVIAQLSKEGIKTNVTAMVKAEQLLLALIAGRASPTKGPAYLSLFFNRIKDGGGNPQEEIRRSRVLLERVGSKSEIITGSIREEQNVYEAIVAGTHIVTVPPKIIWEMVYHEQSAKFIDQSQKSWEKFVEMLK